MDPATRNRLMDELEAAKEAVADAEWVAGAADGEKNKEGARLELIHARALVASIENKFPECQYWASRHATAKGA